MGICVDVTVTTFITAYLTCTSSFSKLSSAPCRPLLTYTLFVIPKMPLVGFISSVVSGRLLIKVAQTTGAVVVIKTVAFKVTFTVQILMVGSVRVSRGFDRLDVIPRSPCCVCTVTTTVTTVNFSVVFGVRQHLL